MSISTNRTLPTAGAYTKIAQIIGILFVVHG